MGRIFKIIPGPASSNQLDHYFVAEHNYSAEYICKAFGIEYMKANSIEDIEEQMEEFYQINENGRPILMEIFTPSDINHLLLQDYFAELK